MGAKDQSNPGKNFEELMANLSPKAFPRQQRAKCCGILIAGILLLVVIFGVLVLTVFRFKDLDIELNSVTIKNISMVPGIPASINVTLREKIVVENQNWGKFKYDESAVILSYEGALIGQKRVSSGSINMRQKDRFEVDIEGKFEGLGTNRSLVSDMNSGLLEVHSYTRLSGEVNMMKMIKNQRTAVMNCRLMLNLTRQAISDFFCHSHKLTNK